MPQAVRQQTEHPLSKSDGDFDIISVHHIDTPQLAYGKGIWSFLF